MFHVEIGSSENKQAFYGMVIKQLEALLAGESNKIANLANASALLGQVLEEINWVGFYLMEEGELVLGPFQGKVACIRIPVGKGVCGTAVSEARTQVVPDVHAFPGHIACDSASQSEIVVPISVEGKIVGVLDIDSPVLNRFDEEDGKYLEVFTQILAKMCKW